MDGAPIPGLHAAGELVGGLFYHNYPGGSGLMAGSVFGRLAREEIFAPVVGALPFNHLDDAISAANSSAYGLQTGVYTSSIATALRVARELEVGGIIINGTSSTRADGMP